MTPLVEVRNLDTKRQREDYKVFLQWKFCLEEGGDRLRFELEGPSRLGLLIDRSALYTERQQVRDFRVLAQDYFKAGLDLIEEG